MQQHSYDVRKVAHNAKITEARSAFPKTETASRPHFAVPRTFLAVGPLFVFPLFLFPSVLLNVSIVILDYLPRADGLLQQLVA
jgi:hypothetical protein